MIKPTQVTDSRPFNVLVAIGATVICIELILTGETNIIAAIALSAWTLPAAWGQVR